MLVKVVHVSAERESVLQIAAVQRKTHSRTLTSIEPETQR